MQFEPENSVIANERWVSGAYIISGVFPKRSETIDVRSIQSDIPMLFDALRKGRRNRLWPRGICGYYAIPVYVCRRIPVEAVEWVQQRPKYRYAMWHEPILYDHVENVASMNAKWGEYGIAFRSHLSELIFPALINLAHEADHHSFPILNGEVIEY